MCANKLIKFILIQIEIDNLAIVVNFKKNWDVSSIS